MLERLAVMEAQGNDVAPRDGCVISDDYRALNRDLHRSSAAYGTSGRQWARFVRHLVQRHGLSDVLDYGCGKQTLAKALPDLRIRGYDPAFEDLAAPAAPADLVVCSDVLEHVEPQHLDAVFDDLARCTRRFAFVVVSTRPAQKQLADGRNAHLSQMPVSRWLAYILPRFDLRYMVEHMPEFEDRGWKQRIARWAFSDVRMAELQSGDVVLLLSAKTTTPT